MGVTVAAQDVVTFSDLFRGRTDARGLLHGECIKEPVGPSKWAGHLSDGKSLGIYPLRDDGTCSWACGDIDRDDPQAAVRLHEALHDVGLNQGVYIERSKSKGYHVWALFSAPIAAKSVRRLFRVALHEAGLPSTTEIFPKQDALDGETRYGNYVNLPYAGGNNAEGRRMMVDPTTFRPIPLATFLATGDDVPC